MGWPTTDDPRTKFVTVRFTEGENDDINLHAKASGETRSAYVRRCVDRCIEADKRRAKRTENARGAAPSGRLAES